MGSQVGFQAPQQLAAGEHHAPPAALAFQANVGAEAEDGPLIGAAGMGFAQAQMVVDLQVRKHIQDYTVNKETSEVCQDLVGRAGFLKTSEVWMEL